MCLLAAVYFSKWQFTFQLFGEIRNREHEGVIVTTYHKSIFKSKALLLSGPFTTNSNKKKSPIVINVVSLTAS